MATFDNYGELKTFIAGIGHRADLTAEIPGFIQQAEGMIAERLRATEMLTVATLDETNRDSGPVYNLPDDFLGARKITGTKSSQRYTLKQVSIDELYRYGLSGTPQYFTVYGRQAEFRASPATDTEFTLIYFARPAAFSADADTHTVLTNHPTLYVHGAMHWFHVHTQDLEMAEGHAKGFDTTVIDVNALADEVRGAGTVANAFNFDCGGSM